LKISLFTQKNVFYINSILIIATVLATFFLFRNSISVYLEKDKFGKTYAHTSNNTKPINQQKQLTDYSLILQNNPFGIRGGELRPLNIAQTGRATQTNIILLGTVVGPKNLSYGIFKDSSGIEDVFKIGESVFGLGNLYSVKYDKVLLRDGGRVVEIPLEDVKVREIRQSSTSSRPFSSDFAHRIGRNSYIVDQRRVHEAISNPRQMMTDARLKPRVINGKEEGFVLSEVKPRGIYQNLGLRDGDILLRINEYDISNPERALQAFTALKGLDRVQIDLIRDGAKMTITYQIK
jgi:general secretion pathway protein C